MTGREASDETPADLALFSGDNRGKSPLVEITTHIRADQALALEILENAERQRFGSRFDKAQLIQKALDLLIAKSFVAIQLAKNTSMKLDESREEAPGK
jgi:hypothetical protein